MEQFEITEKNVEELRMNGIPDSLDNQVGLFFIVRSGLLLHSCKLADGEPCGSFLNYPFSHDKVWWEHYQKKYHVDFDYYPRGRIVYNKAEQRYILYYDGCIENEAEEMLSRFSGNTCQLSHDEHYQCHMCCDGYVI
ncbi:MAG: hypothetical protein PHZ11_07970 [Desulfitobacteriaceae bacterium]|nr:hypothetical protein [Desulfitobacteriaceae bacterium]MDD4402032.1 hypothetical protein [Desulfitobacteriaceae bacterium]